MITKIGILRDDGGEDIVYIEKNGKIYYITTGATSSYESFEELKASSKTFEVVYGEC